MDKSEVLRKSELFRDLTAEQLKLVEKLGKSQVFEPGTIICKQGTKIDNIYVIEDGLVGLILELGPLSERQVQAACNFEVFGWSAMIEPYVCSGTVKAVEKTKVFAFRGGELRALGISHPEVGNKIWQAVARVVASRLHRAYVQLLGVTYQD